MALVTPVSLTLSNGFVQWSRDPDEVNIDPTDSVAEQVAAILAAVDNQYPITFQRGAIYKDLPAIDFDKPIPYIAWHGDPEKGRPRLRFKPSAGYGFSLEWMKNWNTSSFLVIGLDMDGANNGQYTPHLPDANANSGWCKTDFWAIKGRKRRNDSTSHSGIVIEDCVFRRWDTGIHMVDDETRYASAGTEGAISIAVRRNMFLDMYGADGHSVGLYGEGWADGSLIEQNFFDYNGHLAQDYRRSDPTIRGDAGYAADDRSHGIYLQLFNGRTVIRENIFRQCSANMAQHRAGGNFDYNVGFYCALSTNTGAEAGGTGEQRIRGNLFGHQVDISPEPSDRRGKAFAPFYSSGGLTFDENIAFDRRGSATGGSGNGIEISNADATGNVLINWWHMSGRKTSGSSPSTINVTGLGFRRNGKYYEIRAIPGGDAYVEQPPHNYTRNYQVPAPRSGYSAAGWPDITEQDAAALRGRKLGEWRNVDHVSYYIDPARALAKAAVQAEYGTDETALNPITWTTHTVVYNGIGGNQDDGVIAIGDGSNSGDDPDPVATVTASAGLDAGVTLPTDAALLSGIGADSLGRQVSYSWSQVSGPTVSSILWADQPAPYCRSLSVPGTYVFQLTVTNPDGLTATDTASVIVGAAPVVEPDPVPDEPIQRETPSLGNLVGIWREFSSQTYDATLRPYKMLDNDYHTTVADEIIELYETVGVNLLVRHRPLGDYAAKWADLNSEAVGDMQLDSALYLAADNDWKHIVGQFEAATERIIESCPDLIIIDYYGTMAGQMTALVTAGNYADFKARADLAVGYSTQYPGIWIGLDASASDEYYTDGGFAVQWANELSASLQAGGSDIIVESLPRGTNGNTFAYSHSALITESLWRTTLSSSDFRRRSSYYTFRVLNGNDGLLDKYNSDADLQKQFLLSCRHHGHIPILAIDDDADEFRNKYLTVAQSSTARVYDEMRTTSKPETPMPGFEAINHVYETDANPVDDLEAAFKLAISSFSDTTLDYLLQWTKAGFAAHEDEASWEANLANWLNGITWLREELGSSCRVVPYAAETFYHSEFDPDDMTDDDAQIAHIQDNLLSYTTGVIDGIAMTLYPTHRDIDKNLLRFEKVKRICEAFGVPVWGYVWDYWPGSGAPGVPTSAARMPSAISRAIAEWGFSNLDHLILWDDPANTWSANDRAFNTINKAQYGRQVK